PACEEPGEQCAGWAAEGEGGGALQEGAQGRGGLQAGQWGAQAVVDVVAEGEVAPGIAADVGAVGGRGPPRVPVGRGEAYHDVLTLCDGRAADLQRLHRV